MFSFSLLQRPNTLASRRMPNDVSEAEKTERIVALQQLQRDIQTDIHEQAVGRVVSVLVDSTVAGATEISGQNRRQYRGELSHPRRESRGLARTCRGRDRAPCGPNSVWGEVAPESGAQLLRTHEPG